MLKRSDAARPVCHLNLITSACILHIDIETPDLVLLYQIRAYIFLCRHTGPKVFQLYVWKDRGLVQDVIKKAKAGGFNALALTADFTWYGNRERDIRNGKSYKMNITETQTRRTHAYTCLYVYMYMYIHVHIYIYMYIYRMCYILRVKCKWCTQYNHITILNCASACVYTCDYIHIYMYP